MEKKKTSSSLFLCLNSVFYSENCSNCNYEWALKPAKQTCFCGGSHCECNKALCTLHTYMHLTCILHVVIQAWSCRSTGGNSFWQNISNHVICAGLMKLCTIREMFKLTISENPGNDYRFSCWPSIDYTIIPSDNPKSEEILCCHGERLILFKQDVGFPYLPYLWGKSYERPAGSSVLIS